ncbi:glutamine-hydrolyzing GMP synthase [Candidatus Gottesmanbacteria bacterium]|nr:glutamine-hydrolyzing GMP synthase [Candidatus Gottesmanbacteria bacterium]
MIFIVDFGSQTAHLIGRRLRQLGVSYEYTYPKNALKIIKAKKPKGLIFSGGPASVYEKGVPTISPKVFSLNIPVLGICYGWQLMAKLLGGTVKNTKKEYGPELLKATPCKLPARGGLMKSGTVIMSHGDTVTELPKGFSVIGSTRSVINAAVVNAGKNFFGVQFHPEAHHTENGLELLKNFAVDICHEHLNPLQLSLEAIITDIKQAVGDKKVICAVSGGVDSTVAAFLIGKAIGKNLIPVYVESGLMRPGTEKRVQYIFTKLIHANLIIVDAKTQFLAALKGITDPERKRKTIGKLYVDIFDTQAKKYTDAAFLGQGTIYSDVIESKGTKHASHIKSHHNVGGLPKDMKLTLFEPLRTYYKDEVRKIGHLAGLPEDIIKEHPFPGPGYAVRIRGKVTKERLEHVKIADRIVFEEMKDAKLYDTVFQCFAVMTGAYSTAVKGDARVFAEVVAIRAYESMDIMTSQWSKIPYDVLARMSTRIVNEVPGVSRVVYDITTKPPATMEWE